MKQFVVDITRKPGIPLSPSPFFADGRHCWIAVLDTKQLAHITDMLATESGKLRLEKSVQCIRVNGKLVYGQPAPAAQPTL